MESSSTPNRKRRRVNANTLAAHTENSDSKADGDAVGLTEMEKHVAALKTRHCDLLLLFECGYRMRIFGDDAERAAAVLGIRAQRHRHFIEASVPVHRVLFHTRLLVNAGCKVGIVRQLESAGKAGQPLDRDVVEVYTRATVPHDDPDHNEAAVGSESDLASNDLEVNGSWSATNEPVDRFIVAVVEKTVHSTRLFSQLVHELNADRVTTSQAYDEVRIGLFAYDIHTGEHVVEEFEDDAKRQRLLEWLATVEPVEFVLPVNGVSSQTEQVLQLYANHQADVDHDGHESQPRCRIERVKLDGTGMNTPLLSELCQLGFRLMQLYLALLRFESVLTIDCLRTSSGVARQHRCYKLSSGTLRDLDVVSSSRGSLFSVIDHTQTPFGARRLRAWICSPLFDRDSITARQDAIELLSQVNGKGADMYETLRDDVLPAAKSIERSLQQLRIRRGTPRTVAKLLQSLASANKQLQGLVTTALPRDGLITKLLGRQLHDSSVAWEFVFTGAQTDAALANDLEQLLFTATDYQPQDLVDWEDIVSQLHALDVQFEECLEACRNMLRCPSLQFTSHRAGGFGNPTEYLIAVDRSIIGRVPVDWLMVSSTKSVVRYLPRPVRTLVLQRDILLDRRHRWLQHGWHRLAATIDEQIYIPGMALVDTLAQLDALCSLATVVRLFPNYTKPRFADGALVIEGGRHPMLERFGTSGTSIIACDIMASQDASVTIVSGPNMGGKSTLLRTVGLLVILAQIGSFVPAQGMTCPMFQSVYSLMHRTGLSASADELHRLSEITKQATSHSLVLLDECGYGLSTHQTTSLVAATLQYLAGSVGCLVLLATHNIDIKQHIPSDLSVQMMVLGHELTLQTADIVYLYAPRRGAARKSFPLQAALLAGLPTSIVDRASTHHVGSSSQDRR